MMRRPPLPRTFTIIMGTVTVLGAIATTCAKLELERRRLEHDKETAQLLEEARQKAMELDRRRLEHDKDTRKEMMSLEYLKFEHEKEKLCVRKTTLTDSLRQRAEHKVLRMSNNSGITHDDASEFIQSIWDGFLEIEANSGQ